MRSMRTYKKKTNIKGTMVRRRLIKQILKNNENRQLLRRSIKYSIALCLKCEVLHFNWLYFCLLHDDMSIILSFFENL